MIKQVLLSLALMPAACPFLLRGGILPSLNRQQGKVCSASTGSVVSRGPRLGGLRMSSNEQVMDVVVVGSGPAGLALTAELGMKGMKVSCVDPNLDVGWIPNYGVWVDEVEPLGLKECLMTIWPTATVFMGGSSGDEKIVLNRPYGRIDRKKIKEHFLSRCSKYGVRMEKVAVKSLLHEKSMTSVKLDDGSELKTRLVVDCTGHSKAFVEYEQGREPGVQAAYGIECDIEPGTYPFPLDEMLLMDYRDVHMQSSSGELAESEAVPTFIYVMPTNAGRVFFEETSLIANPAVPFDDLKRRLYKRLDLWGTKVVKVHEEEFCYIPMGGAMPVSPQRVVGFGGSAGLVHPATGYMLSRTLTLASDTAKSIEEALKKNPEDAEAAAHHVWEQLWTDKTRRQRDFANFGGEYLESIGLGELREFFGAFFVLPFQQWGGFLSHRLVEPYERLIFGLGVWENTSWRVRGSLALKGFLSGPNGWITLARSVLPLAGDDSKQFPSKSNRPEFFKKL